VEPVLILNPVNEEASLFTIFTGDVLKGLIAERAHEARELVVVYSAEREDGGSDTRPEGVPHTVALPPYARGPTLYMDVSYEQLVPAARVFVYLEPKFGRLIKLMTLDEYEVSLCGQRAN
jgi:hypothetical protein